MATKTKKLRDIVERYPDDYEQKTEIGKSFVAMHRDGELKDFSGGEPTQFKATNVKVAPHKRAPQDGFPVQGEYDDYNLQTHYNDADLEYDDWSDYEEEDDEQKALRQAHSEEFEEIIAGMPLAEGKREDYEKRLDDYYGKIATPGQRGPTDPDFLAILKKHAMTRFDLMKRLKRGEPAPGLRKKRVKEEIEQLDERNIQYRPLEPKPTWIGSDGETNVKYENPKKKKKRVKEETQGSTLPKLLEKWGMLDENLEETPKECPCGSGEYPEARYDARGIFLTYTCPKCEKEKLSKYRPDVLSDPNYWHDEPIDADEETVNELYGKGSLEKIADRSMKYFDKPRSYNFQLKQSAKYTRAKDLIAKRNETLIRKKYGPKADTTTTKEETSVGIKERLDEMMTRKHFRSVANTVRSIEDPKKRQEFADHHAEIFARDNPRFDYAKFHAACGTQYNTPKRK